MSHDELENLKRENALMTSAWYDLSSRLQMNTMALQRRNEQPKSWLGKQRVLVNRSQVGHKVPFGPIVHVACSLLSLDLRR